MSTLRGIVLCPFTARRLREARGLLFDIGHAVDRLLDGDLHLDNQVSVWDR